MTRNMALTSILASLFLVACSGGDDTLEAAGTPATEANEATQAPDVAPILSEVASATYNIEPTHASLIWKVSHNGLSNYTARFTDVSAVLNFNAEDPAASTLTATVNPLSVRTDHPSDPDWDTTLRTDEKFFNASAFPDITYSSTSIALTGMDTGTINGDLTFLGVTKQVPLKVKFNGVRNFPYFGARDVIGFSATAKLQRSDFGMTTLLPNIGDEVSLTIETEFLQAE